MLIRDLERKAGLDRATIRYYEKEGLISPLRKENGYREYTDENLSHLLKIKLLRQLGISVDTIKGIQQGSSDFSKALSDQIRNLDHQIKTAARAKEVCAELYRANCSYAELDASYYLQMLSRKESPQPKPSFRENFRRPYHPVRRFLARMTDYFLLEIVIKFIVIVLLRIRPFEGIVSNLISYGVPFLMVPLEAWMLSKWGTTAGKWLYDLRVLSEDGCKLTYSDAILRAWEVLKEGYGFGIPIWSLVRMAMSYRTYQDQELDWDWNSEYQYGTWNKIRKTVLTAVVACAAALTFLVTIEAIKPKYQGNVTVPQFASNYNFYYGLLHDQVGPEDRMRADGTWNSEFGNSAVIYIGGEPRNPGQPFEFETESSCVRLIRYENSWTNVWMMQPVTSQCQTAAIASLMSQKGMDIYDLWRFSSELDKADLLDDGSIVFDNIEIQWYIDTKNCMRMGDQYITASAEATESCVSVVFEIKIHNQ